MRSIRVRPRIVVILAIVLLVIATMAVFTQVRVQVGYCPDTGPRTCPAMPNVSIPLWKYLLHRNQYLSMSTLEDPKLHV